METYDRPRLRGPRIARLALALTVALAASVAGCTAAGSVGGSRDVLTRGELIEAGLGSFSLFDAIQRVRPGWLRSRTTTIAADQVYAVVFVDGTRYGELATLRSMRVEDIQEVRFINARDATTRYGTGYMGGVIAVYH